MTPAWILGPDACVRVVRAPEPVELQPATGLIALDPVVLHLAEEAAPPTGRGSRARLLAQRMRHGADGAELIAGGVDGARMWLARVAHDPTWRAWGPHVPDTGVRLTPLEWGAVLNRAVPAAGWHVAAIETATAGWRQIVRRDDRVVFTRATPASAPVATQIEGTLAYLARLGYRAGMELTHLTVGDAPAVPDATAMPLVDLARAAGVAGADSAEALLAGWMRAHRPVVEARAPADIALPNGRWPWSR